MSLAQIASLIDSIITIGGGLCLLAFCPRFVAKISDPAKKRKTETLMKWGGLIMICSGFLLGIGKLAGTTDPATQAAEAINRSTPKMIDAITRFDRATAGPGQRVVIDQTVITMSAAQVSKATWDAFLPQLRKHVENSAVGKLPAQGITIIYRFHGSDGAVIGELTFLPPAKKP